MTKAKTKSENNQATPLPYNLRRELEEIGKNTGTTFDLSAPLDVLEKICNDANFPRDSWRNRYNGELK